MRISFASQLGRGGGAADPILAQGSNWLFVVSATPEYNDLWQTDTFGTAATADNDVVGSIEDKFGAIQFTGFNNSGLKAPTLDIVGGVRSLDFGADDLQTMRTGTDMSTPVALDMSSQSALSIFFALNYNTQGLSDIIDMDRAGTASQSSIRIAQNPASSELIVFLYGQDGGTVSKEFALPGLSNGDRYFGTVLLNMTASGNSEIIKCRLNGSVATDGTASGSATNGTVFSADRVVSIGRRFSTVSRGIRSKLQFCGALKGTADAGTITAIEGKIAELYGITP